MPETTAKDGWIKISGRQHHYLEWGDPAHPPLLLLHGGNSSAHGTWRRTAPEFADRWHVIAPDHRGHGESAWHPDGNYSLGGYVHDLAVLSDHLGLTRRGPYPVVGHSLGGLVAVSFAARFPCQIGKLVLADSLPKAFTAERHAELRQRPVPKEIFDNLEDASRSLGLPTDATHQPRYGLVQLPDGRWRRRTDVIGIRASLLRTDPDRDRLWSDWCSIPNPRLLIRGQNGHVPTADAAAMSAAGATVMTYPKAGHWVHRDAPRRFAGDVRAFLAD